MKDMENINIQLIEDAYQEYRQSVASYIYYKIGNKETREDLAQDVFLRLMDYRQIVCAETIRNFIFIIARNLTYDYLRHFYVRQEVTSYIYDNQPSCTRVVEEQVVADDLQALERERVARLPEQRRKIYVLARFGGKQVSEIARQLNLSPRTVGNHLYISRKEVREYIRECI